MRKRLVILSMLMGVAATATAQQMSIGMTFSNVSIGINLPKYPELVPVPGYPVYYAPKIESNYFFYDGMYWVYQGDYWYASSWYNGPWATVGPEFVPLYVLRIPVRYYRRPPEYFRGWQSDAPPRWDEHWGNEWALRRNGWDRWDRHAVPARLPLPVYQRKYSGDQYPRPEQQRTLQSHHYRYQPKDPVVRQDQMQQQPAPPMPVQRQQTGQPDPQRQQLERKELLRQQAEQSDAQHQEQINQESSRNKQKERDGERGQADDLFKSVAVDPPLR